jgi:hypothetical protein
MYDGKTWIPPARYASVIRIRHILSHDLQATAKKSDLLFMGNQFGFIEKTLFTERKISGDFSVRCRMELVSG